LLCINYGFDEGHDPKPHEIFALYPAIIAYGVTTARQGFSSCGVPMPIWLLEQYFSSQHIYPHPAR
jgi:hypothetical protein